MFARLGSWCARRWGAVLLMWLAALIVLGGITAAVGNDIRTEFDLPDVESREGFRILEDSFGGAGAGSTGTIVMVADDMSDPEVQEVLTGFLEEVDALDDTTVRSPFGPGGEMQISTEGEYSGRLAYADVEVAGELDQQQALEFSEEVQALAPPTGADTPGNLRIEYGGMLFGEFEPPSSELLGLAFAIVILILAFGSVLAMGLPIAVALGGISVGVTLLMLLSNVVSMPDFATTLGVMIGLGVGIDYALFIVTRHREQMRLGHSVVESVSIAIDTSGRAVVFAGLTVVVSLLGMLLMGISFVQGLALGAATIVAVTMVASITLLPALLGLVGGRIEVTRWRGLIAAGLVAVALVGAGLKIQPLLLGLPLAVVVLIAGFALAPLKKEVPSRPEKPLRETRAWRWSRVVQARPWPAALLSAGFLLLLSVPVLDMRLGFSDDGNRPEETTTRQAYDLLAEGFGPGHNGPLLLVTQLPAGTDPAALAAVSEAVAATEGVQVASPAIPNDFEAPTAALWRVIPTTSPQDEATTDLVHRLRDDVLPEATEGTGLDVAVSGFVAVTVDFSDYLATRLPLFFGAVLTVSFLLLMVVFRSLLVPLKAVVMNLLSIGAAYGLMVAFFQWGWGASLFGIEGAPVEPFLPMMMFAIVFGLSMDYEVFLLSRIREEWVRTGDSKESVADGLAATASVITAAAAIMVVVFGSFLLEGDRVVKLMGFGLAVAVLLDATVVRLLLVPATMELLGDRNWWLPRWLDRIIPHVNVEGTLDHAADRHLVDDIAESPDAVDQEPELV